MSQDALRMAAISLPNVAAIERAQGSTALAQVLGEVFAALRLPIYRYLLSNAGNRLDAEDLTQETFLHLVRAVRRGEAPDNLRSWLFQVAHNLLVDFHRGSMRAPAREDPAWVDSIDAGQDVEQAAICRERLERFLACLSPSERRCIELRLEGLRYREIGSVLGIRVPTVQTFLARAAGKLARQNHE